MGQAVLDGRAQKLLKLLVERYIFEGQPVGSKTLSEGTDLALSSATIRNIMADLEQHGFLVSPHTSAGRVPTERGFRFFVDSLMALRPEHLNEERFVHAKSTLNPDLGSQALAGKASDLLSELTGLAGVVTVPRHVQQTLRHIEFLPLSGNRVLTIMVVNDHEVQNHIIYTDRIYSDSELQQATNYFNQTYVGQPVEAIRDALFSSLEQERQDLDSMTQLIVEMAEKALETPANSDQPYMMAGQDHLVNHIGESEGDKLKRIFEAFHRKRDMLHLLDSCLAADGVKIFIGRESGHQLFDDCSVVTAPYRAGSDIVGVLGVIGPTRMAYDHVISVVDVTAKLLSGALSQTFENETS